MYHLWDKLLKIVGDKYPEELVKFIFPDKRFVIEGKYEQEKVVIEYQTADINLWVVDQGVKKLLNIEPYSTWDRYTAAEVFTRNGIMTKSLNYQYEIISVAVLLEKELRIGKYEVLLEGRAVNQFLFPVVSLRDLEGIIKSCPPLTPFVLKIDMSLKDKVILAVRGDKILQYATVLVLNRLGFSQEEALAMTGAKLQEFKEALAEVPIMHGIFADLEEKAQKSEKMAIARGMLKEGLEATLIAKVTGLNVNEIARLAAER